MSVRSLGLRNQMGYYHFSDGETKKAKTRFVVKKLGVKSLIINVLEKIILVFI
jgi:hypothetical protein